MFVMVMFATQAIYSDRSSGTTFSHWEVPPWLLRLVNLLLEMTVPDLECASLQQVMTTSSIVMEWPTEQSAP